MRGFVLIAELGAYYDFRVGFDPGIVILANISRNFSGNSSSGVCWKNAHLDEFISISSIYNSATVEEIGRDYSAGLPIDNEWCAAGIGNSRAPGYVGASI
jgi:hypothetical protein